MSLVVTKEIHHTAVSITCNNEGRKRSSTAGSYKYLKEFPTSRELELPVVEPCCGGGQLLLGCDSIRWDSSQRG